MNLLAAIDPTTATFVIAVLVLMAGVVLALAALRATTDTRSGQAFAAVGVLFGLLAAGGLGGLFANSVAQNAADASATKTAESVTGQVSEEVTELGEQVEKAIETPSEETGSGAGQGK